MFVIRCDVKMFTAAQTIHITSDDENFIEISSTKTLVEDLIKIAKTYGTKDIILGGNKLYIRKFKQQLENEGYSVKVI